MKSDDHILHIESVEKLNAEKSKSKELRVNLFLILENNLDDSIQFQVNLNKVNPNNSIILYLQHQLKK